MLYLADNLAYIPYTVLDEPLYVIHQIDIMISVSGTNLLQTFKEVMDAYKNGDSDITPLSRFRLYVRLLLVSRDSTWRRARPSTSTTKTWMTNSIQSFRGYLKTASLCKKPSLPLKVACSCWCSRNTSRTCMASLLRKFDFKRQLVLKIHCLFSRKISQYSPTDSSKAFDRQVNRRGNVRFNPKATLAILERPPSQHLSEREKEELVNKYLEFKALMNKIDPDEEEDDEDGMPGYGSSNNNTPSKSSSRNRSHPSTPQAAKTALMQQRAAAMAGYSDYQMSPQQQQQMNQQYHHQGMVSDDSCFD